MSKYEVRNIAVVGQTGTGKTSLIERLLFESHSSNYLGHVEDGDTITDFDDQSIHYQHSVEATPVSLHWSGHHINLIDTPGQVELLGRTLSVFPAVEATALVLDASTSINQVSEQLFAFAKAQNKCQMIVINKIDAHPERLLPFLEEIEQRFGAQCLPINLPSQKPAEVIDCYFAANIEQKTLFSSVDESHELLVDQVVEVDESLMELYLEQGSELSAEQLHDAFEEALRTGHVIPVCFVSSDTGAGCELLLRTLAEIMPMPDEGNPPLLEKHGKQIAINCDQRDHTVAHVYKISVDPYLGKIAYVRVFQGEITAGSQFYVGESSKAFKVGHLYSLQGKKRHEIASCKAGGLCVLVKVDELAFDSLIHDSHDEDGITFKTLQFPESMYSLVLTPKKRGDEQKLSDVLTKILAEDPSLKLEHRAATNETVLSGQGEFHLTIALEKMATVYKLKVDTHQPSVEYFETITCEAEGQYRHKKQSGGAGQFGEVHLSVKPLERGAGFSFVNKVVGGSIPTSLIPAVEKGVRQALAEGAISGNPIKDIEVTVLEGKHHSVDSKEIAFVIAGKKAFLQAVRAARPIVLEPIVDLVLEIPMSTVGDVTGDLAGNRGLIVGSEQGGFTMTRLQAKSPINELQDYSRRLKAITGGEGRFSMTLSHYEPAPSAVQNEVCSPADE
ncbi:elongation factor G [Vibrio methylphosphonaticus]|uniref:elongation factor G n=1 Tax=Vibrio methylphosphonaticus TaxID=2946866 RepID=UPI002029C853|nr:elongation factor G [Vibrio methylphosphonaticus]MCL9774540.1 elongation factor G [Vibrio methylphosphonaticus]